MSARDRLKESLAAIVQTLVRRVDYHAMYPAKVNAQNEDGSLELTPESSRIPNLSRVPIRYGLPGAGVKVDAGTRVLLSYENGDATRPFACLWNESATTIELKLDADTIILNSGDVPVAKEGSATTGHTHTFIGVAVGTPGTTDLATDTIATGEGSQTVRVP